MLHTTISIIHGKRKAPSVDDILEVKRSCNMFSMKQEFNNLLWKKKDFLTRQRRTSLLVDPLRIEDNDIMAKFANFYRRVSNAPMAPEEHSAQLALIEQVIQESIIIEWPKHVHGLLREEDSAEIDFAPLIHRARNVVKCRTSHPTMRIKVCAISRDDDDVPLKQPKTVEAFFRATLVKLSYDGNEPRQVAGRMILTQREGTPATKCADQNGATVNSEGKLIASQAAPDTHTYVLLDQMGERNAKTTGFKYENGVLCATFPEMGVTLNSMVDRRQLATRYAIQVEVALNIDNKLLVNHTVLSHPFLIAITNDQTEPLLFSIFWHRLFNTDHDEPSDSLTELKAIPWNVLKQAIKNYVKSQIVHARSLEHYELCHIQCMILLPRIIRCQNDDDIANLEMELFGDMKCLSLTGDKAHELRDRLLEEQVLPNTLIDKREFMVDKCTSILDMTTEIQHTVWQWLFRATEMIQDVGHKLCPSPVLTEKKGAKTKKQMAASEEYQTMLSLFNKGILTFSSTRYIRKIYRDIDAMGHENDAIMMRFCDENCGYLSFAYGYDASCPDLPLLGSISAEQVKDFKQGLSEVLMDEQFPSKFDRLIKIDAKEPDSKEVIVSLPRKRSIFHSYQTLRLQNDSIHVMDEESIRVNPLTGEKVARVSPPPTTSFIAAFSSLSNMPQLKQNPISSVPAVSNTILSFLQHQFNTSLQSMNSSLFATKVKLSEGFDLGTLLRTVKQQDDTENSTSGVDEDVLLPESAPSSLTSVFREAIKDEQQERDEWLIPL